MPIDFTPTEEQRLLRTRAAGSGGLRYSTRCAAIRHTHYETWRSCKPPPPTG